MEEETARLESRSRAVQCIAVQCIVKQYSVQCSLQDSIQCRLQYSVQCSADAQCDAVKFAVCRGLCGIVATGVLQQGAGSAW